ncbi:uncharacterized protein LOC123677525 [Harmonia axyridis]|uniref:uncharacterized protein LOC123677525 n=1 Tax=Harmonia axyridis TaxID=115357 RepID=UPI001E275655|nr:uncharacterized protein LOC123677525 [Harmonia axyridis]
MNMQKLCQNLIVKKFNNSDVLVNEFRVKEIQYPYGSIHIRYKRNGIEETCSFLKKSTKIFKEKMNQLEQFKVSHLKENILQVILKELEGIYNVNFTPEIYFASRELIVFDQEPTLLLSLDYSENQFKIGLSTLAKFHATSVAYTSSRVRNHNIDNIDILQENPLDEKNITEIYSLISKYITGLTEIYPETFIDDISLQDIEEKFKVISRKLNKLQECKKTLINGNYRYQNLIFNAINTECKIGDFSYAAYQSPLFDVFEYISSFSTKSNWRSITERTRILYYELLQNEMKKLDVDISEAFPKKEYEETFELLSPIMKIIHYLKPIHEKFKYYDLITDNNISDLCSSYIELSEILNVLNLKYNRTIHSIISFEDCYMVFKKIKNNAFKLCSYETKPQQSKNGFLGEHHDMTIEMGKQGEKHIKNFFLKAVPQCEALQEFEKSVGSFFKETMFYSRYIPLLREYGINILDKVVPECYFADKYKYIILDDLKSYGYTTLSPRSEIKNEVVLLTIKILAAFNASCIILEESIEKKTGYKYRLPDEFGQELNEAFYSLEPVIETHRNSGKGGMTALTELIYFDNGRDYLPFKSLAEEACNEQVYFAQPSKKWRNTLCHGDFWTKNFMIKLEENQVENVMMIDFQTYRYAPPAQDLMAFIYLNTSKKLRDRFMNDWLDSYYEIFAENLHNYSININNILPRKDFDESCQFYKQFAITQSITHFQIILVPPEIIDPLLQDEMRAREIFLGSRYNLVKMVWQIDEIYRQKITESVEELESCLITKIEK